MSSSSKLLCVISVFLRDYLFKINDDLCVFRLFETETLYLTSYSILFMLYQRKMVQLLRSSYIWEYKLQKYANFILFNEADGTSLGLLSKKYYIFNFLDFHSY